MEVRYGGDDMYIGLDTEPYDNSALGYLFCIVTVLLTVFMVVK